MRKTRLLMEGKHTLLYSDKAAYAFLYRKKKSPCYQGEKCHTTSHDRMAKKGTCFIHLQYTPLSNFCTVFT
jgi:hypothetical protein